MNTYLVVDCGNLVHRRYHAQKSMRPHFKDSCSIIAGFLSDLLFLAVVFPKSKTLFCFDHGPSRRVDLLPTYKSKRVPNPGVEDPLKELKTDILYSIGYRNIFFSEGAEADDWIGQITKTAGHVNDRFVVVSNDSDFYQLLDKRTTIWNPHHKAELNFEWFHKQHGLAASQWVTYKAIVGCMADEVPGVPRVGEVTAKAYLKGELVEKDKGYQRIKVAADLIALNERLVTIPFDKLKLKPEIKLDQLTEENWKKVTSQTKCHHLRDKFGELDVPNAT